MYNSSPPFHGLLLINEQIELISLIKQSQESHNCMTPSSIREFVSQIFLKRTGSNISFDKHWWERFLLKYHNLIQVQNVPFLDEKRGQVKKSYIEKYYDSLSVALSDNVDPSLVLNMDETGCSS